MVPRPNKATMEPVTARSLTVAGRCNPMKVKKPRRRRVNRVKQGAPSKLSASQKRKLVRLYVFTNLSWKDISQLVLRFGTKDIKLVIS